MSGSRGAFAGGRGSSRPSSWDGMDRSAQLCVFFAQGKCTKGDSCPFSHTAGVAANDSNGQRINQEPDMSHTLPRVDMSAERVKMHADTKVVSVAETRHIEKNLDQVLDSVQTGNGLPIQDSSTASLSSPGSPPLIKLPDGAMYVIGPDGPVALDAVVRTMGGGRGNSNATPPGLPKQPAPAEKQDSTYHRTNDQDYTSGTWRPAQDSPKKIDNAVVLHAERASTQGGVIALADGGFITRKRAAEMQLRDDRGDSRVRHIRQREIEDQEKSRERRTAVPETRSATTGSSRGSIMDRLGPATLAQGRIPSANRAAAPASLSRPTQSRATPTIRAGALGPVRQLQIGVPAAERASNPVKLRTEPGKREEKRQHNAPPPENVKISTQTSASSALSVPQTLGTARPVGTARPTRRLGGGRGESVGVKGGLGTTASMSKSSVLDFKVPTLDEIKSRKAKAARETAKATIITPQETTREKPDAPLGTEEKFDVAHKEMSSPDQALPSPEATVLPLAPPELQLHAADMDEFSEWL